MSVRLSLCVRTNMSVCPNIIVSLSVCPNIYIKVCKVCLFVHQVCLSSMTKLPEGRAYGAVGPKYASI